MVLQFLFKQLLWVQLVLPIFLKFGLESGFVWTCKDNFQPFKTYIHYRS